MVHDVIGLVVVYCTFGLIMYVVLDGDSTHAETQRKKAIANV